MIKRSDIKAITGIKKSDGINDNGRLIKRSDIRAIAGMNKSLHQQVI